MVIIGSPFVKLWQTYVERSRDSPLGFYAKNWLICFGVSCARALRCLSRSQGITGWVQAWA